MPISNTTSYVATELSDVSHQFLDGLIVLLAVTGVTVARVFEE